MPTQHEQALCRCERRWGTFANTHWDDGRRVCDACSCPVEASCAYADPHCPCSDGESACHYEWAGDSPPWVAPKGLTPRRELLATIARLEAEIAAAVAAERERCAGIVDAECARVLSLQTGKDYPHLDYDIDRNLRMTTVLLPEIAAAIREPKP